MPPWLAIEKENMHRLATLALSFSVRRTTFDRAKTPDSLKTFFIFIFIFHFHVSHLPQDSGYDRRARMLWSRRGFLLFYKAKSTPWQVVSAPQRLALEFHYGLPTYPQVEQGWDFPEVVL
jgi:hypothetical protein